MSLVEPQRYFGGWQAVPLGSLNLAQQIGPQPILPADAYRIAL